LGFGFGFGTGFGFGFGFDFGLARNWIYNYPIGLFCITYT
jgi:hypothetical protein